MMHQSKADEDMMDKHRRFNNELKMFVNQKLFEKGIISEDMYWTAKELLLKEQGGQSGHL